MPPKERGLTEPVLDAFAQALALYVYEFETSMEMPHQDSPERPGVDMVYAEESPIYDALYEVIGREQRSTLFDATPSPLYDYIHTRMYAHYRELAAKGRAK